MKVSNDPPATVHGAATEARAQSEAASRYQSAPPSWVRMMSGFLGFFSSTLALGIPAIVLLLFDRAVPAGTLNSLPALLALGFGTVLSVCLIDLMRMKALESYFSNVRSLVLYQDAWFAAFWILAVALIHPLLGLAAALSGAVLYVLWRFRGPKQNGNDGVARSLEADPLVLEAVGLGAAYAEKASNGEIAAEEQPDFQTLGQATVLNFVHMLASLIMLFTAVWLHMGGQISLGTAISGMFLNQYAVTVFVRCFQVQALKPQAPDLSFLSIIENHDKPDRAVQPADDPMVMLSIQELENPGFEPLSVDVFQGLCLAFIGPSGSGKSSVLRAIATGDFKEGKISYRGRNWGRNHGRFQSLSYVPPTPVTMSGSLVDNVTCFDPMGDVRSAIELIRKLDPYEDVFLAADFLHDSVDENFSAQGQVLSLARAFYQSREIIVLDTPETYLDKASRSALMALILRAKTEGRIVILATDDDYLMSAADEVIKLERGHVTDRGPKDDVLTRHHARWVRVSFLPTKRDAFRLTLWLDTQFPEGMDATLKSRVKRVAQDMLFLAPRDLVMNSNDEILFDIKMKIDEVHLTMHDRGDIIQAERLANAREEGLEDFARIVDGVDSFDQTLREGYRQFSTRFIADRTDHSDQAQASGA